MKINQFIYEKSHLFNRCFWVVIVLGFSYQSHGQLLFSSSGNSLAKEQIGFVEAQQQKQRVKANFANNMATAGYFNQLNFDQVSTFQSHLTGVANNSYLFSGDQVVSRGISPTNPINIGGTNKVIDSFNPHGAQSAGESLGFVATDFLLKHLFHWPGR